METKEVKTVDVFKCARCGYDHASLEFNKFENPIVDSDSTIWNWWALCRVTNEPVLLKIIETNKNGQ